MAPVVRGVRGLAKRCALSHPQLVQDLSGFRVTEGVVLRCLERGESLKSGRGELRLERQRLVGRYQAVAPEERHEPGQTSGRKGPGDALQRTEPQRGKIEQASAVRVKERVEVGFQIWGLLQPLLERLRHLWLELARTPTIVSGPTLLITHQARDVDMGLPRLPWRKNDAEACPVHSQLARFAERDSCSPTEVVTPVPERDLAGADLCARDALLRSAILDVEDVCEVGAEPQLEHQSLFHLAVVLDNDVLMHPVRHDPVALNRYRRVHADASRSEGSEDAG
jgi:hypothetical protein